MSETEKTSPIEWEDLTSIIRAIAYADPVDDVSDGRLSRPAINLLKNLRVAIDAYDEEEKQND